MQYRLSATGVSGSLEITRVDWDQYKLKYKLKGDRRSTSRLFRVAGVQNEFQSFLNLVGDWRSGAPAQDRKPDTPPAAPATPSPAKRRNRFDEEPAPAPMPMPMPVPADAAAPPSTTTTTTHHTTEDSSGNTTQTHKDSRTKAHKDGDKSEAGAEAEHVSEWRGRPEEGFRDLALAAAIIESGDTGKTTKVPTL